MTFGSLSTTSVGASSAGPKLVVSGSPARTGARPLSGRSLAGAFHVFVRGSEGVTRVRYYLDGRLRAIRSAQPFDLAGRASDGSANALTTARLENGGHSIRAELRYRSGRRQVLEARFAVRHLIVSVDGASGGSCTESRPCRSFDRAYDLAVPGQGVEVREGTYPEQTLTGDKAAPQVVFRPAPGAQVQVGAVSVRADNLEFQRMRVADWNSQAESDGFTARDLDVNFFQIYGSSNVAVVGGDVGPSYSPGANSIVNYVTYGAEGTVAPRGVLIDGVYFHDFRRGMAEDHMECLMVVGGDRVTIRNSRFVRCDIFDIFFTKWAGPEPAKNVLLENNFFNSTTTDGSAGGTSLAVQISGHVGEATNYVIRNNSFAMPLGIEGTPRGVRVVGNVMPWSGCVAGVEYAYNVTQDEFGRSCGTSDRLIAGRRYGIDRLGFRNADGGDLHLVAGSPAINRGDPKAFPRTDIDGQRRPKGRRPDAGADEAA